MPAHQYCSENTINPVLVKRASKQIDGYSKTQNPKQRTTYKPAISLLRIYPKELKMGSNRCLYIVALLTIANPTVETT